MTTVDAAIPSGLIDTGVEFFYSQERLYAIYNGQQYAFEDLPAAIIDQLKELMYSDKEAVDIFLKSGPKSDMDRMYVYYKCSCGGLDQQSDFIDGELTMEYWNCECNGCCILEPRFKKAAIALNGTLTRREMKVIRTLCVHPFPTAIQAAHILHVSPKTLDNHKQSIYQKTGANSIQHLTSIAIKSGWL